MQALVSMCFRPLADVQSSFPKARYGRYTLDNETYLSSLVSSSTINILEGAFFLVYDTRAQFPCAELLSNGFKTLNSYIHC